MRSLAKKNNNVQKDAPKLAKRRGVADIARSRRKNNIDVFIAKVFFDPHIYEASNGSRYLVFYFKSPKTGNNLRFNIFENQFSQLFKLAANIIETNSTSDVLKHLGTDCQKWFDTISEFVTSEHTEESNSPLVTKVAIVPRPNSQFFNCYFCSKVQTPDFISNRKQSNIDNKLNKKPQKLVLKKVDTNKRLSNDNVTEDNSQEKEGTTNTNIANEGEEVNI